MANKLTKRDYFEMIKGICGDNQDIVNFCNHEIELLERKSSKGGATKTQTENVKVAEMLIAELAKATKPTTITDLMNNSEIIKSYRLENGNSLSNQKISAILKQQVDAGKVVRVTDKKKSLFSVAD
jgi:hypothetical protein